MAPKFVRIAAAMTLIVGLTACGQKGPLYLPDKGGEVVTRPGSDTRPQSTETAPQPSTRSGTTTTQPEKKNETPPK
jgi:predicted small lipoprotein YifL